MLVSLSSCRSRIPLARQLVSTTIHVSGYNGRCRPPSSTGQSMSYKRPLVVVAALIVVTASALAQNDWKTYGNDAGHTKFSTLTQITPENVPRLTKAWEFDTKTLGR